jgi:hypothetical protein
VANQDTGPYPLSHVLYAELEAVRGGQQPRSPVLDALQHVLIRNPDESWDESSQRQALYSACHYFKLSGLCLSGGGIRSASFSLGVIQGLAEAKLLDKFDYLSTVSGGGYIGSWLTAWLRHSTSDEVLAALRSQRPQPDSEPPAIQHLREYSSFLTPKLGVTSADTWTALAIMLRNMLLNWLILLPVICMPVIAVKVVAALAHSAQFGAQDWFQPWLLLFCTILALIAAGCQLRRDYAAGNHQTVAPRRRRALWAVCAAIAIVGAGVTAATPAGAVVPVICATLIGLSVGYKLHRLYFVRDIQPAAREQKLFLWLSVIPAVLAGAAAAWLANAKDDGIFGSRAGVALIGMLVYALTAFWMRVWAVRFPAPSQPRPAEMNPVSNTARDIGAWGVAGAVTGFLIWLGAWLYREIQSPLCFGGFFIEWGERGCTGVTIDREVLLVVFGMPWVLLAMRFGQSVYILLRSYSPASDFEREWLGRAAGWHLIAGLAWIILSALVFLGTLLFEYWSQLALTGALSALAVRFLGTSRFTPAKRGEGDRKALASNIGLALAGPLFAAILLILLSIAFDRLVVGHPFTRSAMFAGVERVSGDYGCEWLATGIVAAVLLGVMLVAGYYINVNRFSLHALYRNRLIRAFLGAGRGNRRRPDGFTGFDDNDNFCVAELWRGRSNDPRSWHPFHVINIALNLASSRRLAWQQRKAMSFAATPLFCGTADLGYRRTRDYGNPDRGISLGTAMAISGAAVSPNMGYHSSPSIAFLLTLFNVRLGWWLGNPGIAGNHLGKRERWLMSGLAAFAGEPDRRLEPFAQDAPWLAMRPLLAELFGLTNEHSSYVYLSDGGHFENLGIYEMVRRRCKWIVAIDGGQDPDRGFADLGNAVLKVWIDLGVRIRFPHPGLLQAPKETDPADVPYFALGTIEYVSDNPDDPDHPPRGHILYIKPTVRGDESAADLLSYKRAHTRFPHQSTGDQWFDEPQLEGYRVLGRLIIERITEAASPAAGSSPANLTELFERVAQIDPKKLGSRGTPEYT